MLDFSEVCKHTLSANEIRQYCECPRKRYYASRDCLALRTNTLNRNLELGRAVHLNFQYYYTELNKKVEEGLSSSPSIEEIVELMKDIPPLVLASSEEGGATLSIDDQKTLDCIVENYKPIICEDLVTYSIVSCEEAFNMSGWPINQVMYHGSIDMVVQNREDKKYYYFEHKTCTNFRPEIYDRFDIQLHIYDAHGYSIYGDQFGGMILNQVKKAKTVRGFDTSRNIFNYNNQERGDFFNWIKKKTEGLVSPENKHEPCNNYMSCKMCPYASLCMFFGYEVPTSTNQVLNNELFKNEFSYDPRETTEENE